MTQRIDERWDKILSGENDLYQKTLLKKVYLNIGEDTGQSTKSPQHTFTIKQLWNRRMPTQGKLAHANQRI